MNNSSYLNQPKRTQTEVLIARHRAAILENLNNAIEGGYDELLEWSPEVIAEDMRDKAADMEDLPDAVLVPVITEWKAARS